MVKFLMLPSIYVANTKEMGRGIYTSKPIMANTEIERSPVIVLSKKEREEVEKTLLYYYIFEWGPKSLQCCIGLGFISVYNHSYKSNCEYEMHFDEQTISINTIRAIKAGEELFLNYNGNWN
ncbi:MAG TPA: SET domain-containing protein-lysine N-methyltransferase, partial [Flavitalea sp.]|nr:SET domain-containing protein-lysine N-methyltransferase [Flavitalea sp.]